MKELGVKNNFLGLEKKYSSLLNSAIAVLSVHFNSGIRSHSNFRGLKEILMASQQLELFDEEMAQEIGLEKGICTIEPFNFQNLSYLKASEKIGKSILSLLDQEKFVISICSDHSASLGIIKAHHEKFNNLSILHLDSKSNLKKVHEAKSHHDSLMSKVSEFNPRIIQVGIRSQSREENELRKQRQIRQFLATEIKLGMYGKDWQEIVNRNFTENVYLTLDLSGMDPAIFPSVVNPEPGGLLWDEIIYLLKIIGQDHNIVGADISAFMPQKDDSASPYFAAKLIYKILNYAFHKK
jgi:agmatinase